MNPGTLDQLNDKELAQLVSEAQRLLQARVEKRRNEAMERICEIAATAQIIVTFDGARKSKRGKVALRAGNRYVNPVDASQAYIVGKGKQPNWFVALRNRGRLPPPAESDLVKPKEASDDA